MTFWYGFWVVIILATATVTATAITVASAVGHHRYQPEVLVRTVERGVVVDERPDPSGGRPTSLPIMWFSMFVIVAVPLLVFQIVVAYS